jgi:predicted enzyme related to lactoylglutathione lyase
MRAENRIDYVEIPVTDLNTARDFFSAMFGWSFQSWGDDYLSFHDGQMDGGFRRSAEPAPSTGVLVVFFSTNLKRDFDRVQELGATISEPIFQFPGGRRFHFIDPAGTEFAIWAAVAEPTSGE